METNPNKSSTIIGDTFVSEPDADEVYENPSPLIQKTPSGNITRSAPTRRLSFNSTLMHSILPTCLFPAFPSVSSPSSTASSSRRRHLTGTLFGPRKGRVTFAIQSDPTSPPGLMLELAFQTADLVQEMATGTVRILLECEKKTEMGFSSLWDEPVWTMYCNGMRTGYASSRKWGECDKHVFDKIGTVSAGAGVLPPMSPLPKLGVREVLGTVTDTGSNTPCHADESMETMFMRGKFERVIGSKDSDAFHMMSPDGASGSELSIFLLRL